MLLSAVLNAAEWQCNVNSCCLKWLERDGFDSQIFEKQCVQCLKNIDFQMFDYPVIEQKIAVSFRSSPSKSLPDDGSWPGYQVCEKLMRVGNPKSMAAGDPVTLPPVSTISVSIWVPFVIWEVFTTITHRIHGAGIYMLTLGVYWWDPCYHIYHTWILWVIGKQPDIFRMYFWLKLGFQERWPPHTGMMMSLVGNESWTAARLSVATGEEDKNINLGKL